MRHECTLRPLETGQFACCIFDALKNQFTDLCCHLAGKPALVFDCIYNASLKHHASKDVEFRNFLIGTCTDLPAHNDVTGYRTMAKTTCCCALLGSCVHHVSISLGVHLRSFIVITECALQRIETQHSISLSRTLSTPNISSKGVLERREVPVPVSLFPPGHHHHASVDDESPRKKLIEEVMSSPTITSEVDGPNKLSSPGRIHPDSAVTSHSNSAVETPTWTWSQQGGEIRITVRVPKLVRT